MLGANARALVNPTSTMAGQVTETFVVTELRELALSFGDRVTAVPLVALWAKLPIVR